MSKLAAILANTREETALAQRAASEAVMRARAEAMPKPRDFLGALRAGCSVHAPALIGEIKPASPSRGRIREDCDPALLARALEEGGASCLSVLTDARFFQGAHANLALARDACALPVLRKDFLLEAWQLYQARALGADAALLLLDVLEEGLARDLAALTRELGMTPLLEIHHASLAERALALAQGDGLVGVNARDLHTFAEDTQAATATIARLSAAGADVVAESAVSSADAMRRARQAGALAALVGEALMRADDVAAKARALLVAP